ncbi:MAG: GTP cyclohydrolase II RibA [Patescibacteria group bacterium]|nr:GTP cyclohydrolase II RibA [Patescibacteria group bacterium]
MKEEIENKPVITKIPTIYGDLWFFGFKFEDEEIVAISNKRKIKNPINLRIHSCCFTSEIFGSLKCDCVQQLNQFMKLMGEDKKNNYLLIYFLNHEGRGIGLLNKLKVYEVQRKLKLDTYEANKYLGFDYDHRNFDKAIYILNYFKIEEITIFSNNPQKVKILKERGFNISIKKFLVRPPSTYALHYLMTKAERGGHFIKEEIRKLIEKNMK